MNQCLKISLACFVALLAVVVSSGHAAPSGQYLPFSFRLQDKRSVAGSDAVLQQRLQQQPTGFGGFDAHNQFGLGQSAYYPGVLPLPFATAGFDGFGMGAGGVPASSPYDFSGGFAAFDSPAYPAFHQFGAPATGYPFAAMPAPVQFMMVHRPKTPVPTAAVQTPNRANILSMVNAAAVQAADSNRYTVTSQQQREAEQQQQQQQQRQQQQPEQQQQQQQQYPPQLDQQLEQLLQQYPSLRSLRLPEQTSASAASPVQSVPDLYLDLKPPAYSPAQSANLPSYAATSGQLDGSSDQHSSSGNAASASTATRHPSGTGSAVDYESVASVSYTLPAEYDNSPPSSSSPSAPRVPTTGNKNVIVVSNALYGGDSDNYAPEGLSPTAAAQAQGPLRPVGPYVTFNSNSLSANSYGDSNSIQSDGSSYGGRVAAPKVPVPAATGSDDPKEYFSTASSDYKATASSYTGRPDAAAGDYDKRVRYSQGPISSVTVSRGQR